MSRGLLTVIVGSDGSGKSSLCRDLPIALADRATTEQVYFGSGDGPSSVIRAPLVLLRRVYTRVRPPSASAAQRPATVRRSSGSSRPRRTTPLRRIVRPVWALTLASEKSSKLRAARAARDAGTIVIADRYPQAQFPGISDGPLLDGWSGKRWPLSAIAAWEARPYLDADANGPDLVLRLNVGQAAAEARRPEHDPIDLARRRALVRSLRFADPRTTVVEIDADLPYEDVLAASLEAIERCRQTSGDPAAV